MCASQSTLPCSPFFAVPEMQRSDLAGTVLQLKSLGIDNIMSFEWLAPPPAEVCVALGWFLLNGKVLQVAGRQRRHEL